MSSPLVTTTNGTNDFNNITIVDYSGIEFCAADDYRVNCNRDQMTTKTLHLKKRVNAHRLIEFFQVSIDGNLNHQVRAPSTRRVVGFRFYAD